MERKRPRLKVVCDEEEEDAERRHSPRNRKRANIEVEEDNEPQGSSAQDPCSQKTQPNILSTTVLTVTCGNKTGGLDVEKLHRGEECIESEGRWFPPQAFEEFGGKGQNKKWKTSILYEDKPLQFLFENGFLTTKGYKKRINKKKIQSLDEMSDSSSEVSDIQPAEETEEDDVSDEDWVPGSDELIPENEEEKKSEENVSEAESEEHRETEDDHTAPASDDDHSDSGERQVKLITSTAGKSVLKKEVKVLIKRLPEFQTRGDCQSKDAEHRLEDIWRKSSDEVVQNQEASEHNGFTGDEPTITGVTCTHPSQMSEPPVVGDLKEENGEAFTQSQETKQNEQIEIKAETGNSPSAVSSPATLDIKPETLNSTKDIESTSFSSMLLFTAAGIDAVSNITGYREQTEETEHCDAKNKERNRGETVFELHRSWIKGFEDCENDHNDCLDVPKSQSNDRLFVTGNIRDSPMQSGIKEESADTLYDGSPAKTQSLMIEIIDANSSQDAAHLQVMKLDVSIPQTVQASDIMQSYDTAGATSTGPQTSSDLDTMDLDRLRREKLKMQIKVLRLQEEYYTQKIKEHKK